MKSGFCLSYYLRLSSPPIDLFLSLPVFIYILLSLLLRGNLVKTQPSIYPVYPSSTTFPPSCSSIQHLLLSILFIHPAPPSIHPVHPFSTSFHPSCSSIQHLLPSILFILSSIQHHLRSILFIHSSIQRHLPSIQHHSSILFILSSSLHHLPSILFILSKPPSIHSTSPSIHPFNAIFYLFF